MPDYYSELPVNLENFTLNARNVISNAITEARSKQVMLTNGHILLSIVELEQGWFSFVCEDLSLDPEHIREDVEKYVNENKKKISSIKWFGTNRYVDTSTVDTVKLAREYSLRIAERAEIDIPDLFLAIFDEYNGVAVNILKKRSLDQEDFRTRLIRLLFHPKLTVDKKKDEKRYELPLNLRVFGTNLNLLAVQDKIPPLYGRDEELEQVLEVLCHRERPNSVMLIGEPGVGKTAIVEGLARRIEFEPKSMPKRLRGCQIVNIQMNTMVAGTSLRGQFEDRIKEVIREIKTNPNYILFVDEAHTMIGAGSALGAPSDAANIFKSVLARGEIRMIGATTLGEYKEFIKEDEALDRRFRVVNINEPSLEETRAILIKLRPRLERNYSVKIPDEVVEMALTMSPRYVRHLRLPDKVIGWLDTAAVKVEIAGRTSVSQMDLIKVISKITSIPEDMITRDTGERFESVRAKLGTRVIGQKDAIEAVAKRLQLNKGPLKENFNRPDGVLLFLGPTGVGKTEVARALTGFLFGDEKKMVRIDMSEYQEGGNSVDKLIGSPRGVVGSERGGILTNQLKDNPYTVLLLDEIEKASPNVLNLFLQAFDEGWITDGRGKRVYLSDAIVIMTSNLGSEHFKKLTNPLGFRSDDGDLKHIKAEVRKEVEKRFSPEFLNRIDEIVVFNPLSEDEIGQIAEKLLKEIKERMAKDKKYLRIDASVKAVLVKLGYSLAYGARFLKRTIEDQVKLPISSKWKESSRFKVSSNENEIVIQTNGHDEEEKDEVSV